FLKKVKFAGNKLKKIGKGAFAANVAIRKMEFPDGLEEIESGNIVAKKVILPASVKRAGLDLGPAVKKIYVYGKDTEFYEDNVLSYEQSGIEIFCQKGSKAEKFFREKGGFKIKYIR
ncbi:MAG: hypothetical protein PUH02_06415, partial [bacterium]|nr:hypothetical protein [bacterium]